MASGIKFQRFVEDRNEKVHNLETDTLKILLSNVTPNVGAGLKVNWVEIAAGNGYEAGGATVTVTSSSQSNGEFKLIANNVVITATGGSIGPFRYLILYNNTPGFPAGPGIGWWDNGSSITLADGQFFELQFSPINGILQDV